MRNDNLNGNGNEITGKTDEIYYYFYVCESLHIFRYFM